MNVFVTGVSGFVGTGLVKYLQPLSGINLFAHSRNIGSATEKFKGLSITIVPEYSSKIFDELDIDCVIHLAGIAHDLSNKYKPEDYYKVNFEGTVSVFEDFVRSKARRFIFLSSIKAAVDAADFPVTESVKPLPASDYGKSKSMAERHIQEYKLPEGKRVYIFRPVMIHGKGNKGNLNSLYKYVKSGLPYIFGAYKNSRSFLSAENLNFILLRFLQNEYPSGIYHLADDDAFSTTELVRIISSSLGKKPRIWNFPVGIINRLSKISSFMMLPSERLKQKLTENLVVSNAKLRGVLQVPLPVDGRSGLLTTLQSFHEF